MKNILLATTALVFTAGIASAEVTFSGSGQFGVKNTTKLQVSPNVGADTAKLQQELGLGVAMSLTADNGMTFGQTFTLSAEDTAFESMAGSLSMNGVTFSIGAVAEADVQGGISDVGYDGLDADNNAESLDGSTAHNAAVTYTMGDIKLAYSQSFGEGTATATPKDSYAIGAKWTSGALTLGAGYLNTDQAQGATTDTDGSITSVYAKFVAGPATINAMTSTRDSELVGEKNLTTSGVSIDYAASDVLTITVATSDTNAAGNKGTSGLGIAYNLGGGAKFVAGYSSTDGAGTGKAYDYAQSSAGFTFSF